MKNNFNEFIKKIKSFFIEIDKYLSLIDTFSFKNDLVPMIRYYYSNKLKPFLIKVWGFIIDKKEDLLNWHDRVDHKILMRYRALKDFIEFTMVPKIETNYLKLTTWLAKRGIIVPPFYDDFMNWLDRLDYKILFKYRALKDFIEFTLVVNIKKYYFYIKSLYTDRDRLIKTQYSYIEPFFKNIGLIIKVLFFLIKLLYYYMELIGIYIDLHIIIFYFTIYYLIDRFEILLTEGLSILNNFFNKNIISKVKPVSTPFYSYISILIKGLKIAVLNTFNPKVTISYPSEKAPLSTRFRGEHALRRYYNGEERCIACKLCEVVCPALAINIENEQFVNGRKTKNYEIDMSKCIYCGLCQEACPVEAIVESNNYEYFINKKSQFIFKKSKLLLNGIKWETELFYNIKKERIFR